jgi:predicted transposase YbfD/YdcC
VIAALDPALLKRCFVSWGEGLREAAPDLVAVDGKTSRRAHARSKGREPLHLVSAWAGRRRLVLGQEAASGRSSEITAIPLLLERLALKGALVGMVEAPVERAGRTSRERRCYLGSARLDAATFARALRGHGGIENRLRWVLDVVFRDDLSRLRTGHGPEDMAVARHMAMSLLRQARPGISLKSRRKRDGWSTRCLETLIRQSA